MPEEKLEHVFLVIDGNRRYAKKTGIPVEESYKIGGEKVTEIVKHIFDNHNVSNITIFALAFSNLKGRHAVDIMPILESQEKTARSWLDDDFFRNVRIRFIGKINDEKFLSENTGFSFPKSYIEACKELERKTAANAGRKLNILIAYSGKTDALDAQKNFAASNSDKPSFDFYEHNGPDIDLIIRTSESRPLSDGPAHLCYFSEFFSINKFWPEIEREDIDEAISIFSKKDRRLGR